MGMFLNYHNIASNYTPNNLVCSFPVGKSYTKLDPVKTSKPYEEYNTKGELIGYFWHYGESINLEFNIDGEITVETDAIVLYNTGEVPNEFTKGKITQKAYNIADKKSWTCTSVIENPLTYIWTQDNEFSYNEDGTRSIYIDATDYLKDKHIEITLYNFRMEKIYSKIFDGKSKVILQIDPELSKKLTKGIYYCSLSVFNETMNNSIFGASDCILSVR